MFPPLARTSAAERTYAGRLASRIRSTLPADDASGSSDGKTTCSSTSSACRGRGLPHRVKESTYFSPAWTRSPSCHASFRKSSAPPRSAVHVKACTPPPGSSLAIAGSAAYTLVAPPVVGTPGGVTHTSRVYSVYTFERRPEKSWCGLKKSPGL